MDLTTQIITWTLRKERTANMIPFINTWPYDIVMNDLYVPECPFCKRDNVLIPIKPGEIRDIQAGKKKLLVFPCCHHSVVVVDMDRDYLLTSQPIRKV
jgi:hypothetical protein